jgi:L-alanine-DL-glutamate epimerase-like enolase superfamily enzyme
MKIADIRILPLIGEASDEMWTSRFSREENLHTLVEVITDEGVTGLGSVFTSGKLVAGAMELLRPL